MPVELQNGNGITRDVSVSGVFFETDLSISAGTGIIFSIILEHVDPAGPIRLHCHGEVVRVERVHDKFGVAVAIDQHRFDPIEAFSRARLPWIAPDRAC
jgi:hypothetical protein